MDDLVDVGIAITARDCIVRSMDTNQSPTDADALPGLSPTPMKIPLELRIKWPQVQE